MNLAGASHAHGCESVDVAAPLGLDVHEPHEVWVIETKDAESVLTGRDHHGVLFTPGFMSESSAIVFYSDIKAGIPEGRPTPWYLPTLLQKLKPLRVQELRLIDLGEVIHL